MDTKNIILDKPFEGDNHLPLDFKNQSLEEGEVILWKGVPVVSSSILDIKIQPDLFFAMVGTNAQIIPYLLIFSPILFFSETYAEIIFGAVICSVALMLFLIPDYLLYQKKLGTSYVITSKKVIFNLWSWGKIKTHSIPLSEVIKTKKVDNYDYKNLGSIFISMKYQNLTKFKTPLFISDSKSEIPVLDCIRDADAVFNLLEETISKNKGDEE